MSLNSFHTWNKIRAAADFVSSGIHNAVEGDDGDWKVYRIDSVIRIDIQMKEPHDASKAE
jgi:hypothetical protein